MSDTFGAVAPRVDVPRHGRNGNPLVLLPEYAPDPDLAAILRIRPDDRTAAQRKAVKGKCAYYSRASSAGKAIESEKGLTNWKLRMAAIGLSLRPDLLLNVAAHAVDPDENKRTLDDLCESAIEAAKASTAAHTGTALHKLAEYVDQGVDVPNISEAAQRDLAAYKACMVRYGVEMLRAERFVVCDELAVAGTFDRTMRVANAPGMAFVGDIKTGNTSKDRDGRIEVDALGRPLLAFVSSVAVQLAVYANSELYDPATGARAPLDVDKTSAIVIHLPQGTGQCELHWLNIADGWEAAHHAKWATGWQGRRDLAVPFTAVGA